MNITERLVAKLHQRCEQCKLPSAKIQLFKQFQRAENAVFGRHLTQKELTEKVKEWKKKGFIE
jgi:hypothetical protein